MYTALDFEIVRGQETNLKFCLALYLLIHNYFADSFDYLQLRAGDCFGTLEKVEGREPNSK